MEVSYLNNTIESLSITRPLFHSEADFQLSLGLLLGKRFEVRLEKPFVNIPLNSNPDVIIPKLELDIFLPNELVGIELKYKTISKKIDENNEEFDLKNHGAQNLGRYDFFDDIRRLQSLKKINKINSGIVIFLTNDHLYWNSITRRNFSKEFDMSNRLIPSHTELSWIGNPSSGSVTHKRLGNRIPILVENNLCLEWREYSSLNNMNFKYLLVQV